MKHIYIDNNSVNTLIMLHGTGGNEEEMVGLGKRIDPNANILSIRGNVNENGINRYFKRLGVDNYDIPNYKMETKNLINAIIKYSKEYNFDLNYTTISGFSNGANIALGIIQINPIVNNYILNSPDYINKDENLVNLENKNIFIATADNDPYVKPENMQLLIERIDNNGGNLKVLKTTGHQINMKVLESSISWYNKIITS